jgi:hypothetical protein
VLSVTPPHHLSAVLVDDPRHRVADARCHPYPPERQRRASRASGQGGGPARRRGRGAAPKARGRLGLLRRRSSSGGHCLTRARLSRRLMSSLRPCSSCLRARASARGGRPRWCVRLRARIISAQGTARRCVCLRALAVDERAAPVQLLRANARRQGRAEHRHRRAVPRQRGRGLRHAHPAAAAGGDRPALVPEEHPRGPHPAPRPATSARGEVPAADSTPRDPPC